MTFLAPAALAGLLLLALPILVHLFKPRRVRQTPFSSLRWLHLTQQRMARRIQWHQILLFFLRVAFISLLVLAIARPLFSPDGEAGSIDRILCIDVSRSMGRRVEGRDTPLQTARAQAANLVRAALPGDRTALLLAGNQTTVLAPWTSDAALYLPALENLEPSPTEANLDAALETIRSLIAQRRAVAHVEICFLTDRPSGGWTQAAIAQFVKDLPAEPPVSLRLIDVALPAPRNGWLASARLLDNKEDLVLRVTAACIGDAPQSRTLKIAGLVANDGNPLPVTLSPGRTTEIDLPLPSNQRHANNSVEMWLEPGDELPDDDHLFVHLGSAGALRVLLVESDSPADASQRPGLHLRTAIAALAEAGATAADANVTVRSPSALTTGDIGQADVILLADISALNESQADALTRQVQAGAGAAIFLGPGVEAEVYNQRFTKPLERSAALLPARLGTVVQVTATRAGTMPWGNWNGRSPLLTGLVDPLLGDLAAIESRAYYRFADPLAASDEVLATLADGTPGLIARQVGSGRVVVVNASADDRWCDLPRRKSYVPLVDRLLAFLQSGNRRRSYTAGEPIVLTLPAEFADGVSLKSPAGAVTTPRIERAGDRALLRLDGLTEAGFYRVESTGAAGRARAADLLRGTSEPGDRTANVVSDGAGGSTGMTFDFIVQPGRGDSPLRTTDADSLRSWWAPAKFEIVKPTAGKLTVDAGDRRIPLEPWLLALACLVFLAEMILVHVLCPRLTPTTAVSRVRRGFVPPLRSRQEALQEAQR